MSTCQKKITARVPSVDGDMYEWMCTKPGIVELNTKVYCPRHARGIVAAKKNKEKYKNKS